MELAIRRALAVPLASLYLLLALGAPCLARSLSVNISFHFLTPIVTVPTGAVGEGGLDALATLLRELADRDPSGFRRSATGPSWQSSDLLDGIPGEDNSVSSPSTITNATAAGLRALTRLRRAAIAAALSSLLAEKGGKRGHLQRIWANILQPGGRNALHSHPHSVVAGVLHVDDGAGAGRDSSRGGNVILSDPRPAVVCNDDVALPELQHLLACKSYKTSHLSGLGKRRPSEELAIPARSGQLLLWPAWLPHRVSEHRGERGEGTRRGRPGDDRISLAFNLWLDQDQRHGDVWPVVKDGQRRDAEGAGNWRRLEKLHEKRLAGSARATGSGGGAAATSGIGAQAAEEEGGQDEDENDEDNSKRLVVALMQQQSRISYHWPTAIVHYAGVETGAQVIKELGPRAASGQLLPRSGRARVRHLRRSGLPDSIEFRQLERSLIIAAERALACLQRPRSEAPGSNHSIPPTGGLPCHAPDFFPGPLNSLLSASLLLVGSSDAGGSSSSNNKEQGWAHAIPKPATLLTKETGSSRAAQSHDLQPSLIGVHPLTELGHSSREEEGGSCSPDAFDLELKDPRPSLALGPAMVDGGREFQSIFPTGNVVSFNLTSATAATNTDAADYSTGGRDGASTSTAGGGVLWDSRFHEHMQIRRRPSKNSALPASDGKNQSRRGAGRQHRRRRRRRRQQQEQSCRKDRVEGMFLVFGIHERTP